VVGGRVVGRRSQKKIGVKSGGKKKEKEWPIRRKSKLGEKQTKKGP